MGFPAKQKTWTVTANNALTGATLNEMMSNYLLLVADFLVANGYTCKGSCDGVTGAMDAVNRWATNADTNTRGANTTTANSWMVLTDGNGCDILMSYVGSTDDIAYLAYSIGGVYVAAGTPAHTPTATDELLIATGSTVINGTAAATDRTFFGWVDSQSKLCRFLLTITTGPGTAGGPVGMAWGVELIDSSLQDMTITPSVWGFGYSASAGLMSLGPGATAGFMGSHSAVAGSLQGGRTKINGVAVTVNGGVPLWNQGAGSFSLPWSDQVTELQNSVGYPIMGPLAIGGSTTSRVGVVARLYDWWTCRYNNVNTALVCDTYDAKNFVAVGNNGGLLWPWDGVTTPVSGGGPATAQNGQHTGFENTDDPYYAPFMNGESVYVPLANSAVAPTGPTAPKTISRRAGVDVIRLNDIAADPTPETDRALMYSRVISGRQALFCRYPDGTVYQVGAGGV